MEFYHGTLHFSVNDGFPHYVFVVEEKRKVFIRVDSITNKGLDCVYMFHSKELGLLGEMSVSKSFKLCPHGSQIMGTEFVLCANDGSIEGYGDDVEQNQEKSKGLLKMGNIFKSYSYKPRFSSMKESLLDHISVPNLELVAIVVKDHVRESRKEVEIGGWGLKFLGNDRTCESCKQNVDTTVIVPAGFHGGPRTRNGGGASGLVERWRSGGSCDCGGWDLGCPLTVLNGRPKRHGDSFEERFSFDLFLEGSKQSTPVLKMVEASDGFYDIHYKSTLSPLQSLSIVVAAIHSHNPRHTI